MVPFDLCVGGVATLFIAFEDLELRLRVGVPPPWELLGLSSAPLAFFFDPLRIILFWFLLEVLLAKETILSLGVVVVIVLWTMTVVRRVERNYDLLISSSALSGLL